MEAGVPGTGGNAGKMALIMELLTEVVEGSNGETSGSNSNASGSGGSGVVVLRYPNALFVHQLHLVQIL